ncbi:MAG: PLP-dependent aminotransferase family protein [Burkholderiaceae bacterium]|nr:MAG: PLP-dependent aminotransferase family protein [Burkholderiaceae bacterium]TAM08648.1 MAG: PLP-dependent aminotransferase family protein [Pusillimonas sp.]
MPISNFDKLLTVDPSKDVPIYRQIYIRLQSAIAEGLLKPGDRITSARVLAKELGLARGTVVAAYDLLASEGYTQSRGQAGTIVTPGLLLPLPSTARPAPTTANQYDDSNLYSAKALPFQMGLPALDAFPRKTWTRLGARHLRAMQPADMDYPFPLGLYALRNAIAAYLQVARGISCTSHQVIITSGYHDTLQLVVRALLEPADRVWVEDPGYPTTSLLLSRMGIKLVPVPVDDDGLVVSRGLQTAADARMAVVTPAHQCPLCLSLSLPRRMALLDWAARSNAWVVEDDYDGEYRYTGRPLPALKSLDRHGRVLYAGTFSKVMYPGLRLAYLVVPDSQVERFAQARKMSPAGIPEIGQAVLASFINNGHFTRHIHRMRNLYAQRREATAAGLAQALGKHMFIQPQPGGMHLVLRLVDDGSDKELAARMREHGMYAQALSGWSVAPTRPGLLLGFTNIDSQEYARQLGERMRALML